MKLFGNGRAAIADDRTTAEKLAWPRRRRSLTDPEIVLCPREGDPRREPWVTPPGWRPSRGAAALWERPGRVTAWSYLADVPGTLPYLAAVAGPSPAVGRRVGVLGLGRVGGTAAAALIALPAARACIRELVISDADAANQDRWLHELQAIAEWPGRGLAPRVRSASAAELFRACEVVIFAAAKAVPPVGTAGDVRMAQLKPNRTILGDCLYQARKAAFTGLFIVVSDPVEWLAQAAFVDSNVDGNGRFTGRGLAPERIAGLALGVMWARALACARDRGWEDGFRRCGAAFGPHGTDVIVFDDLRRPDRARSATLTSAAREGNYRLREKGFLPYVGPAVSSVALSIPRLLTGREVLASCQLDGIYFGSPARWKWGVYPSPRSMAPSVRDALDDLHGRLCARRPGLGLTFADR